MVRSSQNGAMKLFGMVVVGMGCSVADTDPEPNVTSPLELT